MSWKSIAVSMLVAGGCTDAPGAQDRDARFDDSDASFDEHVDAQIFHPDAGSSIDAGVVDCSITPDARVCGCTRFVVPEGKGSGDSAADPIGSIARALMGSAAGAVVCVGARDESCRAAFDESFAMPPGVVLRGGFRAGATDFTDDPACETVVRATDPRGVVFGRTATEATEIEGMTLVGEDGGASSAVTVEGAGTLTRVRILGGSARESIGLSAIGADALAVVRQSEIAGADGVGTSTGVYVEDGRARVIGCEVRGGHAYGASRAVHAVRGRDVEVFGNDLVAAGSAPRSVAIDFEGAYGGRLGANRVVRASLSSRLSAGMSLVDCDPSVPIAIEHNERIDGGGSEVASYGIFAERCRIEVIDDLAIVGASALTENARALECRGAGTHCYVFLSTLIGSEDSAADARAIAIIGGAGSRLLMSHATACPASSTVGTCVGLDLGPGAPEPQRVECVKVHPSYGLDNTGVALDAETVFINNLIEVNRGDGLALEARSAAAEIHSNTIVRVDEPETSESALIAIRSGTAGRFFNNIVSCLGESRGSTSYRAIGTARPIAFVSNSLHGCATVGMGTSAHETIASLEAALTAQRSDARLNMSFAPDFIRPGNYHLRPGSAMIDRGVAEMNPLYDWETEDRPMDSGYDIGADEFGGATE